MPKVEPWGQLEQLAKEKEVVGFYISGHPLDQYKLLIQHVAKQTLPELADLKLLEGKDVTVAGIITVVQHRTSKTGKPFGTFAMEDYMGSFEFILFGDDYIKFRNYLSEGLQVCVRAKVQTRFGQAGNFECKIQKIDLLSEMKDKTFSSIKLKVGTSDVSNDFVDKIELLINTYPGKCGIEIHIEDKAENLSVKMFSKTKKIDINDDLMNELNRLTGVECELKS